MRGAEWLTVIASLGVLLLGTAGCREVGASSLVGSAPVVSASEDDLRRFAFDYEVELAAPDSAPGSMHVFIPIAGDTTGQRVLDLRIDAPVKGRIETDSVYGNRFWGARIPPGAGPVTIRVAYQIERRVVRAGDERGEASSVHRFLAANERVVVDHPVLAPILGEIREASPGATPAERARAIYDWVVDNIEYKKVGSGWGHGDTFWACSERYGNCTDFHSLFISLARSEGIPARFEIGFPVPSDREVGEVSGYHCWVEFWLPETGWFPVDASEAFKHPEHRELFYGTHPADRLHMTTGRDLQLGADHRDHPLNYFVYPYVEIDGKRSESGIRTRFRYRDLPDPPASAG
jgi:transglutaminase-like putative cysteine protease